MFLANVLGARLACHWSLEFPAKHWTHTLQQSNMAIEHHKCYILGFRFSSHRSILVGGLEHQFYFPYIGNNHPNWLIFFRGVQTTNQYKLQTVTFRPDMLIAYSTRHCPWLRLCWRSMLHVREEGVPETSTPEYPLKTSNPKKSPAKALRFAEDDMFFSPMGKSPLGKSLGDLFFTF